VIVPRLVFVVLIVALGALAGILWVAILTVWLLAGFMIERMHP